MSIKNSNDTIGNRTGDLLACSAVPQPTASPRAPHLQVNFKINICEVSLCIVIVSESVYNTIPAFVCMA
jgi:hypothetical protein